MNLGRARYLLRRLGETPPSFLKEKAVLELRRRLDRWPATRASRRGQRLGGGYARLAPRLAELGERLREALAPRLARLDRAAGLERLTADLERGVWPCLGYGAVPLVPGGWLVDDVHGARWPLEHFARLDFVRPDERCDVKVPWEKSRMQWFLRAALAERLGPDDARREHALELVRDWIRHNPCGMGPNWVSAMEVAIRAANLLVGYLLLEPSLDEPTRASLLAAFGEHRRYLARFPETSDVPGNHYLASVLGRALLAFPDEARATQELAALERCALQQFPGAGLHLEHAPVYHRLTLDMVATGRAFARLCLGPAADERAPGLLRTLVRGEAVGASLAGPGGRLPIFGDADGGMVFDLGQEPRTLAHLAAHLHPRESASPEATHADRLHAALLDALAGGDAGVEPEPRPGAVPPFVVLARGPAHLVVRAGAHGLAQRASHDHDDQLSFWLTHDGEDVVVEAGCPPYTRDKPERRAGLVSTAHNVVARAAGVRFEPVEGSVAGTVRGGPGAQVVEHRSDRAHLRLTPAAEAARAGGAPREHERRLALDDAGALTVLDRFRFEPAGEFEARWHLPVGATVDGGEEASTVRLGSGRTLSVRFECAADLEHSTEPYGFHRDYGAREEALAVVVRGRASGTVELRTTLRVLGGRGASA